jgi:hypothetical protein
VNAGSQLQFRRRAAIQVAGPDLAMGLENRFDCTGHGIELQQHASPKR